MGRDGVAVDLLGDAAVRVAPLTDHDVGEMLASLRSFPLLPGYRGTAALDVAALPRILLEHGAVAPDARIRRGPVCSP